MSFVFVSSPYSSKDPKIMDYNVEIAAKMCYHIMENIDGDAVPIAPHIICSQWLNDSDNRDLAIKFCRNVLSRCSKMYFLEGKISSGMLEEFRLAQKLNIPVEPILMDDIELIRLKPDMILKTDSVRGDIEW